MGKLTEALNETRTTQGLKCSIGTLLAGADRELRKELADALADADIQHSNLSRALNEMGYKVRAEAIRRHRRDECSCGRTR